MNTNNKLRLLPNYFNIIGYLIVLIGFILALINLIYEFNFSTILKHDMVILGLTLVVISKEKVEDEMIMNFRMKSAFLTLITTVLLAILKPLFDIFFGDDIEFLNSNKEMMSMLFLFLLNFNILKMTSKLE